MKLLFAFCIHASSLLCTPAHAQDTLNLRDITDKSLTHSFDLRISKVDSSLARNEIKQSKVAFFPIVRAQGNVEYLKSFQNSPTNLPVAVIGGSSIPLYTRFQEALTLNATYTVYDFGIRKESLAGAKEHATAAVLQEARQARDLKLQVVDLYARLLNNYKGISSKSEGLRLRQQIFAAKQRLFEAGSLSRVEVAEEALKVAKTLDELNAFKQQYADNLQELSRYTQEKYDVEATIPQDFEEPSLASKTLLLKSTPDAQFYVLEISKARRDLLVTQRQRMPQFGVYSSYTMYGSNKNDPLSSWGNFNQRTISIGMSASFTVFDGFKNRADVEKKRLEIRRLEVERDQKLFELSQKQEKLAAEERMRRIQLDTRAKILSSGKDKEVMERRLSEQKITDKTKWLNEQADSIDRQFQVDVSKIEQMSAAIKQNILAEG